MPTSTLLKGGTLLVHDENDLVQCKISDLLIHDNTIVKINPDIDVDGGEIDHVIDCSGKIISPGFIDTHHHVWQTCLKGTHADETLLEYFWSGNFMNSLLSPEEIFWSELAGAMECIDSGTTTVVDHATVNYTPEHSTEALRATIGSGIRSMFGYCPTPRVASWTPKFKLEADLLPPWVMETFDQLAALNPFGPSGRVRLAFAFDGVWLPKEQLQPLFSKVRQAGSQLITSHSVYSAAFGAPHAPSVVQTMNEKGLLGPDVLLSHNNNPRPEDTEVLLRLNTKVSCTPSTELQMGQGNPVCFMDKLDKISSLGIDCHSLCSAFMPGQMNLALQWARGRRNEEYESQGKWAKNLTSSVQDAYNLGTIQGARSIGMEAEIGSIAVGKRADLVIFHCHTPGMIVAADRDPIAAIVLHSSVRDVDTVIIDGVIRKQAGLLLKVDVPERIDSTTSDAYQAIGWREICEKVLALSKEIERRKKGIDSALAQEGIIHGFYMNAKAHC